MKKTIILLIVILSFIHQALFSKEFNNLENWVSSWDQQELNSTGYSIASVNETVGTLIEINLKKKDSTVKVVINKVIEFNEFIQSLNAAEKALSIGTPYIDNRGYGSITINNADIVFGTTDIVLILPSLEKMTLTWNVDKNITLDITDRIKNKIAFRYDLTKSNFTYNIDYIHNIKIDTGIGDIFQGWDFYLERLFITLKNGLNKGDPEETDFVKSALINVNNIKFSAKKPRSDYFYISVENQIAPVLFRKENTIEKEENGETKEIKNVYTESRIDYKLLSAFSVKNIGSPQWIYKPFGVRAINGFFAETNITNAISGESIFNIIKAGPTIGFGLSAGIPMVKKNKESNKYELLNELTVFSIETLFNINLINNINVNNQFPLFVNINFCLDLFPSYLAYIRFIWGLSTNGDEIGFVIGARLVFDMNLPRPNISRKSKTTY